MVDGNWDNTAMLNFTFRQLEYFRAVAQQGSISAAAEKQRISRSALASAIIDLEAVLGCQLLIRHKAKGVVLTPIGVNLLEMSQELLDTAGHMAASLRGEELSGNLSIGCFASLGPTIVPSLVSYFAERYPNVHLKLRTGTQDELTTLLRSGEIEIAIGYGLHATETLEVEELYADWMHVILPASHPLAEREVVRASDLVTESLVLLDTPPSSENVRNYFSAQSMPLKPTYRFQDFEVVRSLVARGLGYSIVVQRPAGNISYEGHRVVTRPLEPAPAPVPVCCAWVKERALTALADEAKSALKVLARPADWESLHPDDKTD